MAWHDDLTKPQKRELRRLIGLAHDRELSTALNALEEQFRRWRSGEIGPHDLNDAIHAFHQGPSRQLWVRYSDGLDDMALAFAVKHGIVAEHEIEPDLLVIVKRFLSA